MLAKRGFHHIPFHPVQLAEPRRQPIDDAPSQRLDHDALIEDARGEVARLFGGVESLDERRRRHHPSDAESWRQRFRHRTQIQHPTVAVVGA